jgi:hypothetical protein
MDNYCSIKKINNNKINMNTSHKKYLLTTSFFYLENSYKSTYKYFNGLKKIIEFINSNEEYYLRIYFDSSIFLNPKYKELYEILKLNNKIELFKYTCLEFIKTNPFHIGTFGTLLRFLPLFEKSDYDIIYITDIDDGSFDYVKFYIDKISEKNQKFFFNYIEGYGKRYLDEFNNKFSDTIIANIFVKDYRFDLKIFTEFLNLLTRSNKLFMKIENINNQFESFKKLNPQIKQTYGIDEYFLNICLINTLDRKDICWIKEDLYFNYFFSNLIINSKDYVEIKKKYLIDIINILDINPKYNFKSYDELKNILMDMINIHSHKNIDLRNKFLSNYFKFGKLYKKITLEYYDKFYFMIDDMYIDDFITNDFGGMSWYLKKNLEFFPKNILSDLKLNFVKNIKI